MLRSLGNNIPKHNAMLHFGPGIGYAKRRRNLDKPNSPILTPAYRCLIFGQDKYAESLGKKGSHKNGLAHSLTNYSAFTPLCKKYIPVNPSILAFQNTPWCLIFTI